MTEQGRKVLIAAEQLRRRVPGGIGIYARGLLSGLAGCARDGQDVDVTLLASRRPAASSGQAPPTH